MAFLELLRLLVDHADWRDPNPERHRVTALQHATQAATRAERAGADDEAVIAALVHDAARPLSDIRHGEIIALVMTGKLRNDLCSALWHHGLFQSDLIHGTRTAEAFAGSPWYADGQRLAVWDSRSFDPAYQSEPLEHFLPRLEEVMSR